MKMRTAKELQEKWVGKQVWVAARFTSGVVEVLATVHDAKVEYGCERIKIGGDGHLRGSAWINAETGVSLS